MSYYIHMNHIDICPYGHYYVKFAHQHIYAFLFAAGICLLLIPLWCMQMCLKPTLRTKLFYEQTYFIVNFTTGWISIRFAMTFSISINFIEIKDNAFKMVMMAAILSIFWNTFAWQKPFAFCFTLYGNMFSSAALKIYHHWLNQSLTGGQTTSL